MGKGSSKAVPQDCCSLQRSLKLHKLGVVPDSLDFLAVIMAFKMQRPAKQRPKRSCGRVWIWARQTCC